MCETTRAKKSAMATGLSRSTLAGVDLAVES